MRRSLRRTQKVSRQKRASLMTAPPRKSMTSSSSRRNLSSSSPLRKDHTPPTSPHNSPSPAPQLAKVNASSKMNSKGQALNKKISDISKVGSSRVRKTSSSQNGFQEKGEASTKVPRRSGPSVPSSKGNAILDAPLPLPNDYVGISFRILDPSGPNSSDDAFLDAPLPLPKDYVGIGFRLLDASTQDTVDHQEIISVMVLAKREIPGWLLDADNLPLTRKQLQDGARDVEASARAAGRDIQDSRSDVRNSTIEPTLSARNTTRTSPPASHLIQASPTRSFPKPLEISRMLIPLSDLYPMSKKRSEELPQFSPQPDPVEEASASASELFYKEYPLPPFPQQTDGKMKIPEIYETPGGIEGLIKRFGYETIASMAGWDQDN